MLATSLARRILLAAVAAIIIIALAMLAWNLWQKSRSAGQQSKIDRGQAEAVGKAGEVAVETLGNNQDRSDAIDQSVKEGTDDILAAPEGDRNDAALRANCRMRSYRDTERCRALLPAGAEGVGAGR